MDEPRKPQEQQKLSDFQKLGWPTYLIFGIVIIVLSLIVEFHVYVKYFFLTVGVVFLVIAFFKYYAKRKAMLDKEKTEVDALKREAQQTEDTSKYDAPDVKVLQKPQDEAVHNQLMQQSQLRRTPQQLPQAQYQQLPVQQQYQPPQRVQHPQHHPVHHITHHRRAPPRNVVMTRQGPRHPSQHPQHHPRMITQRAVGACMHCHAPLHAGSRFCPNCGWKTG